MKFLILHCGEGCKHKHVQEDSLKAVLNRRLKGSSACLRADPKLRDSCGLLCPVRAECASR